MSVIEEVKQKTDIVEIVGQYTKLTKAGKNLKGLCPFHSEKHGSFFIYPDEQRWHCFGACNEGGDVFSFIMKQQNITFGDALRMLAEKAGVEVPSTSGQKENREKFDKIYQVNQAAAQYYHNILINTDYGAKAKSYVIKRGLNEKSITDFQLGFSLNSRDSLKNYLLDKGFTEKELFEAGAITAVEGKDSHDVFRNRLMFPITDIKGKCCGFGGRTFEENQAKYINSPQTAVFDKSSNLYGINLASQSIRKEDLAVLVEGYMDVIMAHQYGFSNVVASMGTAVTEKQMNTLKKLTKNLILALDSDTAGEEAMLRCASYENLMQNEIKVAIIPAGNDPDDVIRKDSSEWQKLVNNAIPVIDYTFDIVTAKLDLSTAKDKTVTSEKLLPIIIQIEDRIRRAHYMQKLSRLVGISVRELESIVKKPIEYSKYSNKNKSTLSDTTIIPTFSQPLEEYCLTLLLQFPKLESFKHKLKPEYFENTENREIFIALSKNEDLDIIKNNLDYSIRDYLDKLINKEVPPDKIDQKMSFCILRLHEKFLRRLEMKREVIFAAEAASKGNTAGLSKLEEQGIDNSNELREVFSKKSADGQYRGDINETGKQ
ncbi:MAG: DNA primase [Dehalococcoidales bacterium]|jgi:DNA primase|nr:DNA primase [Dehalococcoidales bacterium]